MYGCYLEDAFLGTEGQFGDNLDAKAPECCMLQRTVDSQNGDENRMATLVVT